MRRLDNEVELAALSHRLVTSQQLCQLGLSTRQIRYRAAVGLLHEVVRDIWCLDPPPFSFLTRATGVCMRYPSGFLSGAASAHYQGMRRGIPDFYEFTVPEASCRPCGVQFALFHYSSFIPPSHIEDKLDGIRVSTPARAVFENASRLDAFALRSMIQAGLERKLFTREDLLEMGKEMRSPGRAGSKLYSHVVGVIPDEVPVDSEEELLLLEALRTAGLPEIVTQYPLKLANGGKAYLDLGVPSARLDVEVDGPEHDTVVAAHRDKSRDAQVAVVGWQTMRFPTKQVRNQLRIVTAQIVAATHSRMKLLGA